MLDNTFLGYYRDRGYKFLPGDRVRVKVNDRTRQAEISAPYPYQGTVCYSGRFLDRRGGYFIDIPEVQILPLKKS